MKGLIGFEQLKVPCIIGVYDHEKIEQELLIDLQVETCLDSCIQSDALEDTLDYDKLAALCLNSARERRFQLIESLANYILEGIFKEFAVFSAKITIRKPQALKNAKTSFVTLSKTVDFPIPQPFTSN